jgi:hypothetical protein
MSYREVMNLRKSDELKVAYEMASIDLEKARKKHNFISIDDLFNDNEEVNLDVENTVDNDQNYSILWAKRAMGWVLHDLLKNAALKKDYDEFKEHLISLKDLSLLSSEKMIFDSCAWQIGKFVFALQNAPNIDYQKIDALFEIIKDFHFTKPSKSYSFLYKAFQKNHQNWSNFLAFADWWDFENFENKDYLKEEYNGTNIMSVAERAYIAYSKKLLEGEPVDQFGHQKIVDKDKIQSFLPKLDSIIERYPEYQYPAYFKAKLLLALGDDEQVLSVFLPFAKQKRNDFWVWELMAELYKEDKEKKFACYCKALSLKTPEDFLVKIRQAFTVLLLERKLYDEAKTEIQKVIETRQKQGWSLSEELVKWTKQQWYEAANPNLDNKAFYLNYTKQAEELLFQGIPEEIIVVEFVNENKSILNFVKDRQKFGFFNYAGSLTKPKIGDLLKVRFHGGDQDGFFKILTAKKVESSLNSEAIKDFEGTLKLIAPMNFGFVEDVYIEPRVIIDAALKDGQQIKGRALLSFNKRKNEWGWKSFKTEQI